MDGSPGVGPMEQISWRGSHRGSPVEVVPWGVSHGGGPWRVFRGKLPFEVP
jgi:hypothetical protein